MLSLWGLIDTVMPAVSVKVYCGLKIEKQKQKRPKVMKGIMAIIDVGESYALMRAKLSLVRKIRCSRVFAHVCVRKFMKMFQNLFDFCSFSTFSIVFLVQKVCFQTLLPS